MPSYLRGQRRDQLRFVALNTVFRYGWKTKDLADAAGISASDLSSQLGHLTAGQAAGAGNILVTGANTPKPARAVKRLATAGVDSGVASVSTYVAYTHRVQAAAAGWSIVGHQRGVRLNPPTNGRRSLTAIATLSNGVLYAFPLNAADFALTTPLGLQSPSQISSTEAQRLATGMTKTRPGKASIPNGNGNFSTFFSTAFRDSATAAGFAIDEEERIEFGEMTTP